jgi:hypothetical protein
MKKPLYLIFLAFSVLIVFLFAGCDDYLNDSVSLSALTISEGTLDPEFSSSVTSYAVALESGTASIRLTPTASEEGAAIEVNDVAVTSGTESDPVTLAEGVNTIKVEVDYSTDLITYSETTEVDGSIVVSLTGGAASEGELLSFGVYDSSQTPGFDPPTAYGTFAIDSAGTGSAPALNVSDDEVFVGITSETYTITVLIDTNLNGGPDDGELIGLDTVTVTGTGAEAAEFDYASLSPYSPTAE